MRALSIPIGDGERRGDLLVRVLIPMGVALVFIGVLLGERGRPRWDLQIAVPLEARAGATVGVRGAVYDLRADGREPLDARVLLGFEGRSLRPSHPSAVGGFEATMTVPDSLDGYVALVAETTLEGTRVRVERQLRVSSHPRAAPTRGYYQHATQQFSLGPRFGDSALAPLDVRVVGGACVPESDCEFLVHVGDTPAKVRLEIEGAPVGQCPEDADAGLLRCSLRVRGNEAAFTLLSSSRESVDGESVLREAGRRVQLPVVLGVPALQVRSHDAAALGVAAHSLLGGSVVLDLYRDGHWMGARSGTSDQELELELEPGRWQLVARRDAYSGQGSTRTVWVGTESARRGAVREAGPHVPGGSLRDRLDYLHAPLEERLPVLPPFSSSAAQEEMGLHDVRGARRSWAALLIFLGGVCVAAVVARRGRKASHEAAAVLEVAGVDPKSRARRHRRSLATVYASAGFVLAAFGVVAAMVLARSCL